MRRYILILLHLCTFTFVLADETKKIKITANQDSPEEMEINKSCNIYISATYSTNMDDVKISIIIENKDEEHLFFIFNRAFTEKDLKKQNIRFDKKSYGSTDRNLRTCNSVDGDDAVQISPQHKSYFTFQGVNSNITSIELPIYITKYKNSNKNKFLIMQREIIHLDVEIETEDKSGMKDFERLNEAYDILISELEEQTFCPNKKHSSSTDEQEKPYKDRIDEIKDEIGDIKSANNWRERDINYKKYKDLLEKINSIDFKKYEKDCGKHKVPSINPKSHACNYSSWTADQVLSSLVRIYKNLDNGKTKKSNAIENAKALQREWTNKACPLYNKMKNAANTKRQAEEYYNSIINY